MVKRIAIIFGTRPEAIKLMPVYLALRAVEGVEPVLISTGQHRDMVRGVVALFGGRLDHELDSMVPGQTLSALTGRLLSGLEALLEAVAVDLAIVQGDTTTAMVGAMAAFYKGVPCAQVEAGLRSGDMAAPFPEEYNRRVIALSAALHFAPTAIAGENLRREGVRGAVHVVGNTAIDAAYQCLRIQPMPGDGVLRCCPNWDDPGRRLVLVTAHRRENFGARLDGILAAVRAIARENPALDVIWPVHPNPNICHAVRRGVAGCPNIHAVDPLPYGDLVHVIRRAHLVLTDSGGIQEEAPAFDTPVIVLRDKTERPEGVAAGCSVVAGTQTEAILAQFNRLYRDEAVYRVMAQAANPYGDGQASRRIADIIAAFTG